MWIQVILLMLQAVAAFAVCYEKTMSFSFFLLLPFPYIASF